ncbi:hypothetical protein RZP94_22490, partial [Citrobacter freundii]|uniref:hypothetical protein n=1 Tax=Citrobacter freundii TaxID=546 RepID=UPI00292C0D24
MLFQFPQEGAHCCAGTPGVQGANRRRASGRILSRCRHPAQRWRVARMQPRQVAAGRGRTAAQIRPALSQPPPPRQRSAAEPFPPSGAVLARSPDVVPG